MTLQGSERSSRARLHRQQAPHPPGTAALVLIKACNLPAAVHKQNNNANDAYQIRMFHAYTRGLGRRWWLWLADMDGATRQAVPRQTLCRVHTTLKHVAQIGEALCQFTSTDE